MKIVLMKFAVVLIQIIYLPFKLFPVKERVAIFSRQSNKNTTDIELLKNRFKEDNVECIILTKVLGSGAISGISYALHMLKQMYYLSTSKLIIVDGYCIVACILPKKDNQKIVQIWHALGAIKKFAYQTIDQPDGTSHQTAKVMKQHRNYDYVLAPSEETGKLFQQAFDVSEQKIKYYGLPRIDYIKNSDDPLIEKINEKYPIVNQKENVLYVPTFRKNSTLSADAFIKDFDFEKYNLIIKKHWLDKTDYSKNSKEGLIVDADFSSMVWLKVCSKVITDYSAIAFEAMIIDREVFFYQPDYDYYTEHVGLNILVNNSSMSKYCFQETMPLFESFGTEYDYKAMNEFKTKYLSVSLDDCTGKLVDFFKDILKG